MYVCVVWMKGVMKVFSLGLTIMKEWRVVGLLKKSIHGEKCSMGLLQKKRSTGSTKELEKKKVV